ncbi:MAG: phytanoyl-CoA dioxygenase family protein [Leucothrix sp.]
MNAQHAALNINNFKQLCSQKIDINAFPLASNCQQNVLCYSADALRDSLTNKDKQSAFQQEMTQALQTGPGVLVISGFYHDTTVIDRHNQLLDELFALQAGQQAADHFAQAGANGRIWNVLQKSALQSPERYVEYYKNPLFSLISEAWLGPHYQLTAQVNVVRPGGKAQAPHRDYHLGFQDESLLAHYPPHVHQMSTMLTLQGAVAHTDMPLASGPTLLLPFSQQYPEGYLAWRHEEFKTYFAEHAVQLALKKGDAMFFNPALFHAAGDNHTADFHRIANLFQVSSAFGRAMETVNREAMCLAIYPELQKKFSSLSDLELDSVLANTCEGYSFPTNLDTDPPLAGMAPQTQKQLMRQALTEQWSVQQFRQQIESQTAKRKAL